MSSEITIRLFETPTAQARGHLKLLLLKLDHIGDFIAAIDAFRVVRKAFAGAEITLVCLPAVVALAESTGLFNRVVGFSCVPDSLHLGKVPQMDTDDQIAIFKELLDGPYFLAADFRHDSNTRVWLDHVDAECRAGFLTPTNKGLDILLPEMEWTVSSRAIGGKNLPLHAETRLTLLAHTIVAALLEKPLDSDLFHLPEELTEIPSYVALGSEQRLKIGVSVGAGAELRKWNPSHWQTLLQQLMATRDAVIIFFGSPADVEESRVLKATLPADRVIDLVGSIPLTHVPAYMNLLDVYIGCDTGLTHLAANLNVPTVNIFAGVSNVSVWRARGARVKTVYAELACAPCHLRQKSDCAYNNICMNAIVPEIVYACFEQVLTP